MMYEMAIELGVTRGLVNVVSIDDAFNQSTSATPKKRKRGREGGGEGGGGGGGRKEGIQISNGN